jgi:hypothetical protein
MDARVAKRSGMSPEVDAPWDGAAKRPFDQATGILAASGKVDDEHAAKDLLPVAPGIHDLGLQRI